MNQSITAPAATLADQLLAQQQKHARAFLAFWTLLYAAYCLFTTATLLERIIRTMMWYTLYPLIGYGFVALEILSPLILVFSIWRMWRQYGKQNFGRAYWATTYPVVFMVGSGLTRILVSRTFE